MKFIAALCMLLDHIGLLFFPLDLRWRIIGRLAMPIFAYGIARGAFYTTSLKRYMKKMLLFSFVSQIPFWGMRYWGGEGAFFTLHLNIGFTFFIALWCINCLQKANIVPEQLKKEQTNKESDVQSLTNYKKQNMNNIFQTKYKGILTIILVCMSIMLADVLGCDYGSYGVLVVLMGYFIHLRGENPAQMALFYLMLTAIFYGQDSNLCLLQSIGVVAYSIIYGTRQISEKRWSKFFYWFYPGHMVILMIVRIIQLQG